MADKHGCNEYRLEATYPGFDDRDDKLRKAVGRHSDASGMGFGVRDNAWYFKTKLGATNALKRVRAARRGGVGESTPAVGFPVVLRGSARTGWRRVAA